MGEGLAGDPVTVFDCPTCGQTIRVSRELAGKRGKCNRCGSTVIVPVNPADLQFQSFAELESSIQFEEMTPLAMDTGASASGPASPTHAVDEAAAESLPEVEALEASPDAQAEGSTSGLISLTPVVARAPVESLLEVQPLEPPPPESDIRLGDLAKAAANNTPVRMAARKNPWTIVKVIGFLLAGPMVFGVGYYITHTYSLRQMEKARREAPPENVDSNYASPARPMATVNAPTPPANSAETDPLQGAPIHEGPKTKETLQGDLAFAMHQAEATVKRMKKGETSFFDQDLADQVKEILRLRGELGLPNQLICKPGSGPDTSGPLGKWNELQAILHPENFPGCEARLAK